MKSIGQIALIVSHNRTRATGLDELMGHRKVPRPQPGDTSHVITDEDVPLASPVVPVVDQLTGVHTGLIYPLAVMPHNP